MYFGWFQSHCSLPTLLSSPCFVKSTYYIKFNYDWNPVSSALTIWQHEASKPDLFILFQQTSLFFSTHPNLPTCQPVCIYPVNVHWVMSPPMTQTQRGVSLIKKGSWEKEYAETGEHLVCLEAGNTVRRLHLRKWIQSWLHSYITRGEYLITIDSFIPHTLNCFCA